jgi:hypothetical protein
MVARIRNRGAATNSKVFWFQPAIQARFRLTVVRIAARALWIGVVADAAHLAHACGMAAQHACRMWPDIRYVFCDTCIAQAAAFARVVAKHNKHYEIPEHEPKHVTTQVIKEI